MRLGRRILLALVVAGLFPLALVSAAALFVILTNLEDDLNQAVEDRMVVQRRLLQTWTRDLEDSAKGLAAAVAAGDAPAVVLADAGRRVSNALVEIVDARGARIAANDSPPTHRFDGLAFEGEPQAIEDGTASSAWVLTASGVSAARTVVRIDGGEYVGSHVVISAPLDHQTATSFHQAIFADVIVISATGRTTSSLVQLGGQWPWLETLAEGGHEISVAGVDYQAGLSPLHDRQGNLVAYVGVALERGGLIAAKRWGVAAVSTVAALALVLALALSSRLAHHIGDSISRLRDGAQAVASGDLETKVLVKPGDEIAEVADAFSRMTVILKDNQQRLAARMAEIATLHQAGRAMSSAIVLAEVGERVVAVVGDALGAAGCALFFIGDDAEAPLLLAMRWRHGPHTAEATEHDAVSPALAQVVEAVLSSRSGLRRVDLGGDDTLAVRCRAAGIDGSVMAAPLDRAEAAGRRVIGVLVVGRSKAQHPLTQADASLMATLADQAASALDNARLYRQLSEARADLERKVELRTTELTESNAGLATALRDLHETQTQLVLSERLAGLGMLVAGVAHEINSPTATIQGSLDALGGAMHRILDSTQALAVGVGGPRLLIDIEALATSVAPRQAVTGVAARQVVRSLRPFLEALPTPHSHLAQRLAELGADATEVERLFTTSANDMAAACDLLGDLVFVRRTVERIGQATARISRIVGTLKSYSHLDQSESRTAMDIHDGIESTLALLDYALRGTIVHRDFAQLPPIPVFPDELNQVWTNLLLNAVHALSGRDASLPPGEVRIETRLEHDATALVRICDNGPGVAPEDLPRIFEPFFTTKPKGEGTGLGLVIARRILERHGGDIRCVSGPGQTCFEVRLPVHVVAS